MAGWQCKGVEVLPEDGCAGGKGRVERRHLSSRTLFHGYDGYYLDHGGRQRKSVKGRVRVRVVPLYFDCFKRSICDQKVVLSAKRRRKDVYGFVSSPRCCHDRLLPLSALSSHVRVPGKPQTNTQTHALTHARMQAPRIRTYTPHTYPSRRV